MFQGVSSEASAPQREQQRSLQVADVYRAEAAAVVGVFTEIVENKYLSLRYGIRILYLGALGGICRIKDLLGGCVAVDGESTVIGDIDDASFHRDYSAHSRIAVVRIHHRRVDERLLQPEGDH